MEDLINVIVKELVKQPDDVKITKVELDDGKMITYKVTTNESDMGRIIGKQGRIAKAVRSIIRAAAVKNNVKVNLEIG